MNWITTYESWSMGGYNEINKTTYDDMIDKRPKALMTSTEIDYLEKMMHENKFREVVSMYKDSSFRKWRSIVYDKFFLYITITKLDDDYFLVHQKKGIPGYYVNYFFLCDEFTGLDSCLKKIIIKDDENEEI